KQPFAVAQHRQALVDSGVDFFRIDFLTRPYDRPALQNVMKSVFSNTAVGGTHSANYSRTLL
ncbi:hypothetical protein EBR21_12575, partial [bacterium]|nr:hypothetical protein [bacterium]